MQKALSWQPDMTNSHGPFYVALSDRMASDIAAGRLVEGDKLPPQRALAWALGVTHGTVTRAYDRAEKMGLVRAEVGRGTFIAPPELPPSPLMPQPGPGPELDLARNFPFPHLDPDLSAAFMAVAQTPGIDVLLNYTPIEGLSCQREAGSQLFRLFDIQTTADQVLLTSGAQHALQVLLQGLFKDGDALAVAGLNYPGLISAAPRLGIRLVPLEMDEQGICAAHLDALCRKRTIAGLMVGANVHNPTGRATSSARLDELAEVAERHDLKVIEDDPYSSLLSGPKATIWSRIANRTCVIATMSKLVGGGLRVGFLHTPDCYRAALIRVINDISSMASPIGAELARHWIMTDQLAGILERKRQALLVRHRLARMAFGDKIELYPDRVSGWLHLPEHINPAVFELEAARRGVSILGAHHFAIGTTPVPAAARLALGALPSENQFGDALTRLKDLIQEMDAGIEGD